MQWTETQIQSIVAPVMLFCFTPVIRLIPPLTWWLAKRSRHFQFANQNHCLSAPNAKILRNLAQTGCVIKTALNLNDMRIYCFQHFNKIKYILFNIQNKTINTNISSLHFVFSCAPWVSSVSSHSQKTCMRDNDKTKIKNTNERVIVVCIWCFYHTVACSHRESAFLGLSEQIGQNICSILFILLLTFTCFIIIKTYFFQLTLFTLYSRWD